MKVHFSYSNVTQHQLIDNSSLGRSTMLGLTQIQEDIVRSLIWSCCWLLSDLISRGADFRDRDDETSIPIPCTVTAIQLVACDSNASSCIGHGSALLPCLVSLLLPSSSSSARHRQLEPQRLDLGGSDG